MTERFLGLCLFIFPSGDKSLQMKNDFPIKMSIYVPLIIFYKGLLFSIEMFISRQSPEWKTEVKGKKLNILNRNNYRSP